MAVNKSYLGIKAGVNYSEDEDEVVLVGDNANTRKKTSRTSATPQKQKKKADGDFDVSSAVEALSDEELFRQLVDFGEDIGPIVDSTRILYRRRLAKLLLESGSGQEKSDEGQSKTNGVNTSESYSADEDEVNSAESQNGANDRDEEGEKESNRVSERKSTPSRRVSNRSANITEVAKELRASADRFVPTARATIHSYTVRERTTKSVVENDKGIISTNTSYERETSTSERSNKNNRTSEKIFSVGIKVLLALVLISLIIYGYMSMGRGVSPEFDRAIDYVATSSYRILGPQPPVEEEDEQPSIANV